MAKRKSAETDEAAAEPEPVNGVVLEHDGRVIDVPEGWAAAEGFPARFEFEGGLYEHVSEDEAGRWVYRRWNSRA